MNLLPPEILADIYVYCLDERLMLLSKKFLLIGKDLQTRASLLIHRHRNNYLALVQDEFFDGQVGKFLISKFRKVALVEIIAEWGTAVGDSNLLEWLILNAPVGDGKGLTAELKGRALVQSSLLGFQANIELLLKHNTGMNL
jgi:hypothetical protein